MMSVEDIKEFYRTTDLPSEIILNQASTIVDVKKFFEVSIATFEGNTPKKIKDLHYHRVVKAIKIIKGGEPVLSTSKTSSDGLEVLEGIQQDVSAVMKPNTLFEDRSTIPPKEQKQTFINPFE